MITSERWPPPSSPAADETSARFLSEFQRATTNGDPIAVYQAILLCDKKKAALPTWLVTHILELIADYHSGKKPSWKKVGNRPLIIIRRRFEDAVRRRAVEAVRAWQKDKSLYQAMPTKCIEAWNQQAFFHQQINTDGDALEFVSYGLEGVKLQADGPVLRCSARTLRRVMKKTTDVLNMHLPSRIAHVFGLTDPDTLFGYDEPLEPNLK